MDDEQKVLQIIPAPANMYLKCRYHTGEKMGFADEEELVVCFALIENRKYGYRAVVAMTFWDGEISAPDFPVGEPYIKQP